MDELIAKLEAAIEGSYDLSCAIGDALPQIPELIGRAIMSSID